MVRQRDQTRHATLYFDFLSRPSWQSKLNKDFNPSRPYFGQWTLLILSLCLVIPKNEINASVSIGDHKNWYSGNHHSNQFLFRSFERLTFSTFLKLMHLERKGDFSQCAFIICIEIILLSSTKEIVTLQCWKK